MFKFNNSFWTCIEEVTAINSAGSPSVFPRESHFIATNQKDYGLWEQDMNGILVQWRLLPTIPSGCPKIFYK